MCKDNMQPQMESQNRNAVKSMPRVASGSRTALHVALSIGPSLDLDATHQACQSPAPAPAVQAHLANRDSFNSKDGDNGSSFKSQTASSVLARMQKV